MKRSLTLRALALALVAAMAVGAGMAEAQTPKKGGVLRIGNLGEPPSLDPHWGTQTITEVLANHVFEGLYALDEGYQPIPMLADGATPSRGTGSSTPSSSERASSFHNGKEMTADDVVASLVRWSKRSIYGKSLFAQVVDLKAVDKYTVEMKLKEKSAIVLVSLAVPNNMAAIYPKEIAEKFPPDQRVTEWVGTGPFKLAEWKPDQYIRMVRFDGYKPLAGKQTGYGGAKIVHVDELRWVPVPDVASRAAQVESGDLDVGDDLDANAYERLAKNPNVQPIIVKPYYWLVAVFNKKEGLMTNQKLRQAWQAAIDIEPIMKTVAARQVAVLPHGLEPGLPGAARLAHEDPGPALERAQQGQGQEAPPGGRLQGRAHPLHDHPGVQVDVRLRPPVASSSSRTSASRSTSR